MPNGAEPRAGHGPEGQSATTLPDGRRLLIGGDVSRAVVAIEEPNGVVQTLAVSPGLPRAWHSATLLGDGTVLIVGGVDANGRMISAPQRFNPATQSFEPLPWDGFARRAKHTATLLTDGRVLIAGGQTVGGSGDAELWNPHTQVATGLPATMLEARSGHSATLQADGRVHFDGGSRSGTVETAPELFDPVTNTFGRGTVAVSEREAARVVWSDPAPGQTDVASNVRLTMRFSAPMSPASVSRETVSLVGPEGRVDVAVVPAERGVLAFVTPLAGLTPGGRYTIAVDGPTSMTAGRLRRFAMSFSTAEPEAPENVARDPEDWSPDPANAAVAHRPHGLAVADASSAGRASGCDRSGRAGPDALGTAPCRCFADGQGPHGAD